MNHRGSQPPTRHMSTHTVEGDSRVPGQLWARVGSPEPLAFSSQLLLQLHDILQLGEGNHTRGLHLQEHFSKQSIAYKEFTPASFHLKS